MPKYEVRMRGLKDVKRNLGAESARRLNRKIDGDLEDGIEAMAELSFELAPFETGNLRNSILGSITKLSRRHYMYGSKAPYAQRQEYEHDGNKHDPTPRRFYFRRSVLKNAPEIRDNIVDTIRRNLNG